MGGWAGGTRCGAGLGWAGLEELDVRLGWAELGGGENGLGFLTSPVRSCSAATGIISSLQNLRARS